MVGPAPFGMGRRGRPSELEAAADDVVFLRDELRLDEGHLRREVSPVLRRLLVDSELQRAWNSRRSSDRFKVTATSLDALLGSLDRSLLVAAWPGLPAAVRGLMPQGVGMVSASVEVLPGAGGDRVSVLTPTSSVYGSILAYEPKDRFGALEQQRVGRLQYKTMSLGAFLDSPAVAVRERTASRREVVTYVANKLGGAHRDERIDRAGHELLELNLGHVEVAEAVELPWLYLELASIAAWVAHSPSSGQLIRQVGRR